MKSISEVVSESLQSTDKDIMMRSLHTNMMEFYGGEIPGDLLERYNSGEVIDYVWENLQTHDYSLLKKQLTKYFPTKIKSFINQTDASSKDIFGIEFADKDLYKDEKFISLLNFFNYFVREIRDDMYIIEPIYSEQASDRVYKECNGILYHFTDNNTAKSILKSGLRIKGRSEKDWKYPNRVYLYAPGFYLSRENAGDWLMDALNVVDNQKIKSFGLAVLKVDLHKLNKSNISFYVDPTLPTNAVFTYNNIPKTCITKLDL